MRVMISHTTDARYRCAKRSLLYRRYNFDPGHAFSGNGQHRNSTTTSFPVREKEGGRIPRGIFYRVTPAGMLADPITRGVVNSSECTKCRDRETPLESRRVPGHYQKRSLITRRLLGQASPGMRTGYSVNQVRRGRGDDAAARIVINCATVGVK